MKVRTLFKSIFRKEREVFPTLFFNYWTGSVLTSYYRTCCIPITYFTITFFTTLLPLAS